MYLLPFQKLWTGMIELGDLGKKKKDNTKKLAEYVPGF